MQKVLGNLIYADPPFFFCVSSNAKLAAAKWIKGIDSDNDDVDQQGGHAAPDFIVANVIIVAPPVRVTKLARIKCDRLSFLIEPRNRQMLIDTDFTYRASK